MLKVRFVARQLMFVYVHQASNSIVFNTTGVTCWWFCLYLSGRKMSREFPEVIWSIMGHTHTHTHTHHEFQGAVSLENSMIQDCALHDSGWLAFRGFISTFVSVFSPRKFNSLTYPWKVTERPPTGKDRLIQSVLRGYVKLQGHGIYNIHWYTLTVSYYVVHIYCAVGVFRK